MATSVRLAQDLWALRANQIADNIAASAEKVNRVHPASKATLARTFDASCTPVSKFNVPPTLPDFTTSPGFGEITRQSLNSVHFSQIDNRRVSATRIPVPTTPAPASRPLSGGPYSQNGPGNTNAVRRASSRLSHINRGYGALSAQGKQCVLSNATDRREKVLQSAIGSQNTQVAVKPQSDLQSPPVFDVNSVNNGSMAIPDSSQSARFDSNLPLPNTTSNLRVKSAVPTHTVRSFSDFQDIVSKSRPTSSSTRLKQITSLALMQRSSVGTRSVSEGSRVKKPISMADIRTLDRGDPVARRLGIEAVGVDDIQDDELRRFKKFGVGSTLTVNPEADELIFCPDPPKPTKQLSSLPKSKTISTIRARARSLLPPQGRSIKLLRKFAAPIVVPTRLTRGLASFKSDVTKVKAALIERKSTLSQQLLNAGENHNALLELIEEAVDSIKHTNVTLMAFEGILGGSLDIWVHQMAHFNQRAKAIIGA